MDIDFVVPWVDGADPNWLAEKKQYLSMIPEACGDNTASRFRDWGLMRYWFRGIEQNAPWVRKIHFVTWGHLPSWLDTSHPQINIVKHEDFIPASFLPTYNSNVIDWNIFRIKDLSDNFVLFNDDTFLISKTKPEDFFNSGPCGTPVLEPFGVVEGDWFYTPATNCAVLNKHFNFHKVLREHFMKWFNPRYGIGPLLSTLLMTPFPRCYGFRSWHLPNSFYKTTFEDIWSKEEELLHETCLHRLREKTEPNQWLAECWQYMSNDFHPRSPKFGKVFHLGQCQNNLQCVVDYIVKHQGKCVCINDSLVRDDMFDMTREKMSEAFAVILPKRSAFELHD